MSPKEENGGSHRCTRLLTVYVTVRRLMYTSKQARTHQGCGDRRNVAEPSKKVLLRIDNSVRHHSAVVLQPVPVLRLKNEIGYAHAMRVPKDGQSGMNKQLAEL